MKYVFDSGLIMRCVKLQEYGIWMMVLNDENEDMFEAQHPPMPKILHVLMQRGLLLIYGFL